MAFIKLVRNLVVLVVVLGLLGYVAYFATENHHKVSVKLLGGEDPLVVEQYVIAILGETAVVFLTLGFLVGFLPTWVSRTRVEVKARKDRAAAKKLDKGLDDLEKKHYAGAKSRLAQVARQQPTENEAHLALARVHQAEGKTDEALKELDEALQTSPTNVRLLIERSRVLEAADRTPEAVDFLVRSLEKTGSVGIHERVVELCRGLRKWDRATESQAEIVRLLDGQRSPAAKEARARLSALSLDAAQSEMESGKVEEAIERLRKLAKRDPDFQPAFVTLGDALVRADQRSEAIKTWERALKKGPDPEVLERLERACLEADDRDRVLKLYEDHLSQNPDDASLRLQFAKLCLRLELVDQALVHFEKLEDAGARLGDLRVLKGEALHRKKDFDAAVQEFRRAAADALRTEAAS